MSTSTLTMLGTTSASQPPMALEPLASWGGLAAEVLAGRHGDGLRGAAAAVVNTAGQASSGTRSQFDTAGQAGHHAKHGRGTRGLLPARIAVWPRGFNRRRARYSGTTVTSSSQTASTCSAVMIRRSSA